MKFYLGRNPSAFDARDMALSAFMAKDYYNLPVPKSMKWDFLAEPLNQGETPHCVGFSGADWGICNPVQDNYTNQDGHNFYYKCKIIDGEPNQENGSSVRSIAKVLKSAGRMNAYAFAASVAELKYWLLTQGPVIMGTTWTNNMFTPDADNIVHATGDVAGGHAYLINEVTENNLYGIQNSWDGGWGINGKAYISEADLTLLLRNGGEAVTAVELPLENPSPNPSPVNGSCSGLIEAFITNLFPKSKK